LAGCREANWKLESIPTGSYSFDTARMVYHDPKSASQLRLEFVRQKNEISSYLNLIRYRFQPLATDPPTVIALISIDGTSWNEPLPVLEGRMRLPLPSSLTQRLISALQEGKKIAILVDGFEEILFPDQFSTFYEKLMGGTIFFQNPFKGPTD